MVAGQTRDARPGLAEIARSRPILPAGQVHTRQGDYRIPFVFIARSRRCHR